MMIDANFSQFPVIDENKRIVGVFSYRSLGERVYELQDKIALLPLPVSECLEAAKFLGPDDYIDTSNAVNFYQDDYVIVGAPDQVLGILSVADVFIRLNDFAEAFVLLHETELGVWGCLSQRSYARAREAGDCVKKRIVLAAPGSEGIHPRQTLTQRGKPDNRMTFLEVPVCPPTSRILNIDRSDCVELPA
jgi:CBS domain